MKEKLGIFLVFFGLIVFGSVSGQNYLTNYSEKIKNFSVEIKINENSSFLVKESILYDFAENLRHGIYRDIPVKDIKIKVLKVIDELGHSYPFQVGSRDGYLRIKIGDPQKLIKGEHLYNIFYQVYNGLSFFDDHDELYWNVTGNEWKVPIEKAEVLIYLPEKVPSENLKFDCFTGPFGSIEKNCNFQVKETGEIKFQSEKILFPQEGLTIALGWPKGLISEPSFLKKFFWNLSNYWYFLIPIFVFFYLFREWWYKGKDPRIKKTVIVQYEPPDDLRPAEVSLILKQKITPRDISATIVDLAVRGYLKIREVISEKETFFTQKNYELIILKDFNDPKEKLRNYEREILKSIFQIKKPNSFFKLKSNLEDEEKTSIQSKVLLSEIKKRFYFYPKNLAEKICQDVSESKYFFDNPQKVTEKWFIIGMITFLAGWISTLFFKNPFLFLSFFFSAILFFIFSPFMPKRTKKGTEAYWYILGFHQYINLAEKYRAQFYEKENIFEKYLPYAIIFGITDKWAKAFEGIFVTHPSWYEGKFAKEFTSLNFTNSLNNVLSAMDHAFSNALGSRSSGLGRGFSGGGRGGGGGGSW